SLNLFSNDVAKSNTRFLNGGIGDLNASNAVNNAADGLSHSILLTSDGPSGDVTLAPGASINVGAQGLALIAAPNVTNHGQIIGGDGSQAALIAGVGVSYTYNAATSRTAQTPAFTDDGSTTFLIFYNYGKLTDASGKDVTPVGALLNDGLVNTPTGNITLLGG